MRLGVGWACHRMVCWAALEAKILFAGASWRLVKHLENTICMSPFTCVISQVIVAILLNILCIRCTNQQHTFWMSLLQTLQIPWNTLWEWFHQKPYTVEYHAFRGLETPSWLSDSMTNPSRRENIRPKHVLCFIHSATNERWHVI